MQVDVLRENDNYVEALQTATHSGEFGLDNLPSLLIEVIGKDRWRTRWVRSLKREVTFSSFTAFATEREPAGLGASIAMLKRMCGDNPAALSKLDEAVTGKPGNPTGANQYRGIVDNVHNSTDRESPTGNTVDAAIRRLRKDAPALHSRVLAGELSPHAAMIEAGFRKRTITIKADPQGAAQTIARHFDRDQVSELIACLYEEIAEGRP